MTPPAPSAPPTPTKVSKRDFGAIHLLLLVPLVLCMAVPFYNRVEPHLLGFPFFYWFQFVTIPISVLCTLAVFMHDRKKGQR
ncbi:DUF3311 domain-containing protein [Micrococcales bacterium 31B]|nr:DUF3311 domain-containing protein [Micrococcales bacterium 31B]